MISSDNSSHHSWTSASPVWAYFLVNVSLFFLFVFTYINCTKELHCGISTHAYMSLIKFMALLVAQLRRRRLGLTYRWTNPGSATPEFLPLRLSRSLAHTGSPPHWVDWGKRSWGTIDRTLDPRDGIQQVAAVWLRVEGVEVSRRTPVGRHPGRSCVSTGSHSSAAFTFIWKGSPFPLCRESP